MSERLTPSPNATAERPSFGAVPLDPWRASSERGRANLYSAASIKRIERKLAKTMIDDEWFKHEPRAHELYQLMRASLFGSQFRRIEKNGEADLSALEAENGERVTRALEGAATPEELFTLLVDHPELGSLELAKLSHPFDFEATQEMDEAMTDLMLESGGELLDSDPRYKVKRTDPDLPAAVLLRKQDLMDFPVEGGIIRVVERRGLLVFEGEGIGDELHFDRTLKNPKNIPYLAAKIEQQLALPTRPRYGWVQPQATSYYAKYLPHHTAREF